MITVHAITGDEKQRAWTYAAFSVTLCLLNTLLLVRVSYAQRMFETALAGKEQGVVPVFPDVISNLVSGTAEWIQHNAWA